MFSVFLFGAGIGFAAVVVDKAREFIFVKITEKITNAIKKKEKEN